MGHPVSSHVQHEVSAWRASLNVSVMYALRAEFTCQIFKWIFKWQEQVRMHFRTISVFLRTEALKPENLSVTCSHARTLTFGYYNACVIQKRNYCSFRVPSVLRRKAQIFSELRFPICRAKIFRLEKQRQRPKNNKKGKKLCTQKYYVHRIDK